MKVGLEVFLESHSQSLKGARIGLITNPSGIDRNLRSTIERIFESPELDLKILFGPEHGVRGDIQAGKKIGDARDQKTGLPMQSLYGESKRLSPEAIADLDVIIYDLQGVGARFYTILYTMAYALEGVQKAGKKIIVLDRPNPVAPLKPTGMIIEEKFNSFVGGYGLPIIHGMTVGEMANYFNQEFQINADLEVIPMQGWNRQMWYDETKRPWIYPSPNMPTLETAILFPGTCLFEGTNLSEGRGTTKPFELIGAPWINAEDWADELNNLALPGVGFRPVYFRPYFSKHQDEQVAGVQVHLYDRHLINPLQVGIHMLASVFSKYEEADWVTFKQHHFIDKLAGTDKLRQAVEEKMLPRDLYTHLATSWEKPLADFLQIREKYLLY